MDARTGAEIINRFKNAENRLVLLDYDGTLVKHTSRPEKANLPLETTDIIRNLMHIPKTKVYIITGRSHKDMDRFLDHLPISIIAEHGALIKNGGPWVKQTNLGESWKIKILPILQEVSAECQDSFIEVKNFSLAWHYRNADPVSGYECSRRLIALLEKQIKKFNLKILDGNKVVEVMSVSTGKGLAVARMSESVRYDFILSIGDDATDEEMFTVLGHNPDAITIKVGEGPTRAGYKLNDIDEVTALLKRLTS
jgi:trehalose 6-phosphate synthase/phosphatase